MPTITTFRARCWPLLLLLLLSTWATAQTTRTVTTNADTGVGSLRVMVAASANGDVIRFQAGLPKITLSSAITITTAITITGPGASQLTISGGNSTQIFRLTNSGITLTDLTIADANATSSGPSGGIHNANCSPTFRNCTFQANSAQFGGAMYNYANGGTSSPVLLNCLFIGNSARGSGGVMYNAGIAGGTSSPVLTNCSFLNNSASFYGGAMYNLGNEGTSSPVLTNCSFLTNSAQSACGGVMSNNTSNGGTSSPVMINCVVFGNGGNNTFCNSNASLTTTYCLFEASVTGYSSSSTNQTTTISPFASSTSTQLAPGSPAIDKGNSSAVGLAGISTDLAGNSRTVGCAVDMGPYEYQQPNYNTTTSNITSTAARLNWLNICTASSYEVQWRPAGGTYTTITGIASTSYALTGLTAATSYEWQIRATGTSVWFGNPATFATQYPCPVAPALGSTSVTLRSATLSWSFSNSSNPSPTYEIQVQQSGTASFTSVVTGYTGNTYSLTGLTAGTTYTWKVRANCSDFSAGAVFTTLTCSPPTNPYTYPSVSSASASWYGQNGAVYELQLRQQGVSTVQSFTTNNSSIYSFTGLTPTTGYSWQVRQICSPTESSSFTSPTSFTTSACIAPTNLSVYSVNATGGTTSWYSTLSNVTYLVQVQQQGSSAVQSFTAAYSQYSITSLSVGLGYMVQVQAVCSPTVSSTFSSPVSFTTLCISPSSLAISGISSYGATINWSGTSPRYNLQYQAVVSSSGWTAVPDLTTTQYLLSGLTNGTAYQVRVQAQCSTALSSSFTAPQTFTAACSMPTVSAAPYTNSASLFWSLVAGVSYVVQWRLSSTSTWNTSPVLNEGSGYSIGNLTPSTAYDWQVKAICPDGINTSFTPIRSFRTTTATGGGVGGSCSSTAPLANYLNAGASASSAFLSWAYPTSREEQFEVRWRVLNTTTWNTAANIPITYIIQNDYYALNLNGLLPNTTYEWQVRLQCPNASFTTSATFTTSCRPPTPVVGSTSSNWASLSWYGGSSSTYELQWRQQGSANWTTVSSLTTIGYMLTGLSNNTAYEFQVRGICSPTVSTSFVGPVSFTTACSPPATFYASAPSCTSATVYSGGGFGGSVYELQYRAATDANWTTLTATWNGWTYSLTNLTPNTVYETRVQAICSDGSSSTFSSPYQFTTPACVGVCQAANPTSVYVNDITSSAATLNYSPSITTSGLQYEVRWRPIGTTVWNTLPLSTSISIRLTGLSDATGYEWQVRSICSGGTSSDFSQISFFRTVCNIPFTPQTTGVISTSARLSWNGFGAGVSYQVLWRQQGSVTWNDVTASNEAYNLTGLNNNITYEWRVQTLCSGGGSSGYSDSVPFTTICSPAVSTVFADNLNDNTVRLNWNVGINTIYGPQLPLDGVYLIQWRTVGISGWPNSVSATFSGYRTASYNLTGLTANTSYEWQVQRFCTGGFATDPSPVLTFVTIGGTAPCTSMVTIQNGDWSNPAVWSCNRVPTATDPVQIQHNVTIPNNGTGRAQRINYGGGGKVSLGTAARLLLGQ